MRNLTLGKFRRVRVWIDEVPSAEYECQRVLTRMWPSSGGGNVGPQRAAVEMLVPTGPLSMYGLLGAEIAPYVAGTLKVDLYISSASNRTYPKPIEGLWDEARIGLPKEYAEAIFDGVGFYISEGGMAFSGTIKINCAAHSHISSNALIFKHLTNVLLKLLNMSPADLSDDILVGMFPETYS
jgi:hypothetical protein